MPLLLIVLFIVVPIAELAVIIQVGSLIGVWWTIALLIADSVLGAMLMRSQGRAAWRRFNDAVRAARVPAREVADGVLVIFGGALLLTPGFLSDILGALFLLPPTRALIRKRVPAPGDEPDHGDHGRRGDAAARRPPQRRRRGHRGRRRPPPALAAAGSRGVTARRRRGAPRRRLGQRHLRLRRCRGGGLRARAARARARTRRCAPRQRAGAPVLRPRAGGGAGPRRPRGARRARAGTRWRSPACGRRPRRRSTAGRSPSTPRTARASRSRSRRSAARPSSPATPSGSAAWRATTSRAASTGPCAPAVASCSSTRWASAATRGATPTGSGSSSRAP